MSLPRVAQLVAASLLLTLAGCRRPAPGETLPVPVGGDRLMARSADAGWLERLARATICLARGGPAWECERDPETARVCGAETPEAVQVRLQRLFDSLPRVTLSQSFAMNQQLKALFPGAAPTNAVWDARRNTACRDWGGQPACAAIRYGDLGVLFRASTWPGPPEVIEVFLLRSPCAADTPS